MLLRQLLSGSKSLSNVCLCEKYLKEGDRKTDNNDDVDATADADTDADADAETEADA